MMSKHDLEMLERKEREIWNELHFHREAPKDQRHIPFVNDYDRMPMPGLARALWHFRTFVRRVFKV